MNESFHRLFYPRSVAVIGASGNPLKMGHQCMLSLGEIGFPGLDQSPRPPPERTFPEADSPMCQFTPGIDRR